MIAHRKGKKSSVTECTVGVGVLPFLQFESACFCVALLVAGKVEGNVEDLPLPNQWLLNRRPSADLGIKVADCLTVMAKHV